MSVDRETALTALLQATSTLKAGMAMVGATKEQLVEHALGGDANDLVSMEAAAYMTTFAGQLELAESGINHTLLPALAVIHDYIKEAGNGNGNAEGGANGEASAVRDAE